MVFSWVIVLVLVILVVCFMVVDFSVLCIMMVLGMVEIGMWDMIVFDCGQMLISLFLESCSSVLCIGVWLMLNFLVIFFFCSVMFGGIFSDRILVCSCLQMVCVVVMWIRLIGFLVVEGLLRVGMSLFCVIKGFC